MLINTTFISLKICYEWRKNKKNDKIMKNDF